MQPEIKSLTLDVKAFGDGETGGFEAILSTKAVDRDGETVEPGAFNPLPSSIPIYHAHGWVKGDKPIGKGEPFYDGDDLKVKGTWAPTADGQEMRELVNGGFITSMSAGFFTRERKGKSIKIGELIEGSMTGIPVNTQSLVLSSKDLSERVTAKAVVGSYEETTETLRDALLPLHAGPDTYVWVRATFADSVVYDVSTDTGATTWQRSYTISDGEVAFEDPVEIEIADTIVPKSVKAQAADTAATEAAASAADELERLRQRARVWQLTA